MGDSDGNGDGVGNGVLVLILAGAVFYVLLHFETLLVSKISVP